MEGKSIVIRQTVLGDGTPKICVPIMAATRRELDAQMRMVLESPGDVIEWRADVYRETFA